MSIRKIPMHHSNYERAKGDPAEGWLWLQNGRNAHYFRGNYTLCGRFNVPGSPRFQPESPLISHWARCSICTSQASGGSEHG